MALITTYHRPERLEQALELLSRAGNRAAILGGGTVLNAHLPDHIEEIVDLQSLDLDRIEGGETRLTLGATVTLQSLIDTPEVPELVKACAHLEGPNTLRNQATIGGVVASADAESELLAALLVYDASVTVQSLAGPGTISLSDFLENVEGSLGDGIITEVEIEPDGQTALERVARTPADRPIVAIVGRIDTNDQIVLGACGVAATPILLSPDQLDELAPISDFRGSSEYRKEMAILLANRVIEQLT